jgi:hypothetical protein
MVKAILEGRKTQTRRPIKNIVPDEWEAVNDCRNSEYGSDVSCYLLRKIPTEETGIIYPKYEMGNILYVRETWNKLEDWGEYPDDEEDGRAIYYKADYPPDMWDYSKWRPSIHMPKEAARIFLKVTNLRIEKLQDITIKDAKSEGVICTCPENEESRCYKGNIGHFKELWDSIFANTQKEWNRNPWVEVYEFEIVREER